MQSTQGTLPKGRGGVGHNQDCQIPLPLPPSLLLLFKHLSSFLFSTTPPSSFQPLLLPLSHIWSYSPPLLLPTLLLVTYPNLFLHHSCYSFPPLLLPTTPSSPFPTYEPTPHLFSFSPLFNNIQTSSPEEEELPPHLICVIIE
jgi:hypothetical protein